MVYCNTTDILNSALNKVIDDSSELRAKALAWLNEVVLDLAAQPRQWKFLETTATIVPVLSVYSLPTDFNQLIYIKGTTTDFFFTKEDQLTDYEVDKNESAVLPISIGYTINGNTLNFIPDTITENITLGYEKMLTASLSDSTANTIFPYIFKNFFITGVRMHYYDYDKDGRYAKEVMLYENEMYKVKAWDNQLKTLPKSTKHGYLK